MKEMQDQQLPLGYGLGWFYGRWRKAFERIDKEAIALDARKLVEHYPRADKKKLAKKAMQQAARHSAVVGVMTASPALIPGIGTAVSMVSIVPEEIYLIRKQCEMVLKIAAIFGHDPSDNERLYEIIMLAGTPSRSIEALMVAKYDLRRMAAKAIVQLGTKSSEKVFLGIKAVSRGTLRRLPAIGFFAGGAINYYSFHLLGKKATQFYAKSEPRSAAHPEPIPSAARSLPRGEEAGAKPLSEKGKQAK